MSFLEIKNLSCKIGDFELKDINLHAEKGELLSIIGQSGSGKTVLLESIAGLHNIDGTVCLDDKNITDCVPQKRQIGIVYQDYMLFPNMNVKQNILYPSFFHKNNNLDKMFAEIVDFLNIGGILNRDVKELSGGEKQKTAIARALLSSPKLLLLDEPFNAIDFTFKLAFMEFFKKLHKKYGLTVLFVTHNFKEAMFLSDRSIVLLDGKIYQDDANERLFEHPKNKKVAEFLGFKNILPTDIIDINSHSFFSVNPYNIKISNGIINKDIIFKAKVAEKVKLNRYNQIKVSINGKILFIKTKDDFEYGKTVYVGFNKKDISLFD